MQKYDIRDYFKEIDEKVNRAYAVANEARAKGYDPETKVDVPLAKNMAERVEGLISAVAPQLIGKGMTNRIEELEQKHGRLSWEVALIIAREVSEEKFCKFKDRKEAMEVGIRVGFAYHTVGIVSAPLEGLVEIKIKKRRDGKEYIAVAYAGPVRGAGGTAAAFSVVLTDYIRKINGYSEYDPDEREVSRYVAELRDYHEKVMNLQYNPSEEEIKSLMSHIPVEVDGDPTEKFDVSNYKDLARVETNKIRGGVCLVVSMIALKAPKLRKELKKIDKSFNLDWGFLDEFLDIQKKYKSKESKAAKTEKLSPDYTFIEDLVAGRPVLAYPLANGGFRLRYGRSRASGYSAAAMHPATAAILNKYIATGTQLKLERPGKAAAMTMCDAVEGPTVKLYSGSVMRFDTEQEAKLHTNEIQEIIFLGDILISYGDFYDRAHPLVPAGYCEEWWVQELEQATVNLFGNLDVEKLAELTEIKPETIDFILKNPFAKVPMETALKLSLTLKIPLHPAYTFHWRSITNDDLIKLIEWLDLSRVQKSDVVEKIVLPMKSEKRTLELIGASHVVSTDYVVLENEWAAALLTQLGISAEADTRRVLEMAISNREKPILDIINSISSVRIRDKSGVFIGSRMGRPEKAKMRKLTGSPHSLFPSGAEGGRLRSFQSALEAGRLTADFANFFCESCNRETVFSVCEVCERKARRAYLCKVCGRIYERCGHDPMSFSKKSIDIKQSFESVLKKLGMSQYPDLIKGVRGTSNKDHIPEHIAKGILRAKHNVFVNKDGTTRYDMTELPITHFTPREIGTSVKKLKELGYLHDIKGAELTSEEQILEIKPQDVIIPCCPESPDEGAADVLIRIAAFVDDLLVSLYGAKPFYNIKTKEDILGQLVIGLAPHISAGIVGRIIGFSETQGCLAHPLWHAAHRRDCDGDENCIMLLVDALLNFSRQFLPDKRGGRTMDAPLVLTSILNPAEVDDMVHKLDVAWRYPLEFYLATLEFKQPWDVKVEQLSSRLGTDLQYEKMGFTHSPTNINSGVRCSAYKTLPSMEEKLKGQMDLAEKIRAVDESAVAALVIEKHFLKDIRGNMRKFSTQKFRCVKCNEIFRRPPLVGKCTKCGGRIIFTVSEGSVIKYMEPCMSLARKYKIPAWLKQGLELTQRRIESMFGKESEKQTGLGAWFG